jgi:DNA polymerase V
MQGIGIFDGDVLLVDRAVTAQQNDVIVANYNNELVCKLLDIQHRILRTALPIYTPVSIRECDNFQLEVL